MTSKQEKNMNNENDRVESSKWNGKPVIDKILPIVLFVLLIAEYYMEKVNKDSDTKYIVDFISNLIDYGWMCVPIFILKKRTNESEKRTRSTTRPTYDRFWSTFIILVLAFSSSLSAPKAIASMLVTDLFDDVSANPSKKNLFRMIETFIFPLPIYYGIIAFQCRMNSLFSQARLGFFIITVIVLILWWFGAYSLFEKEE